MFSKSTKKYENERESISKNQGYKSEKAWTINEPATLVKGCIFCIT